MFHVTSPPSRYLSALQLYFTPFSQFHPLSQLTSHSHRPFHTSFSLRSHNMILKSKIKTNNSPLVQSYEPYHNVTISGINFVIYSDHANELIIVWNCNRRQTQKNDSSRQYKCHHSLSISNLTSIAKCDSHIKRSLFASLRSYQFLVTRFICCPYNVQIDSMFKHPARARQPKKERLHFNQLNRIDNLQALHVINP